MWYREDARLLCMSVAENLATIREKIERAAQRSGREAGEVTLLAVSKTVPVAAIEEAKRAGITHLGENRVQEALEKYSFRGTPEQGKISREGITLHMIGTLQRNKARRAAILFDWVQSLDRAELAWDLEKAALGRTEGPLPVLIEVNLTGEESKSGIAKEEVPGLADAIAGCPHLAGAGLMTIARQNADQTELRRTFATLRALGESLRSSYHGHWHHLSMGMSDDYELAIEEGATIVRIGRALFGAR
jgi:pyridoxal phosphate enzyme (YggS family)